MQKTSLYSKTVVFLIFGALVVSFLNPQTLAWPAATGHTPQSYGPFYDGQDPNLLDDTIDGRLQGSALFREGEDTQRCQGPWGYAGDGTVELYLPDWDYGPATFTVFPEYFVKRSAVDTTVGLKIGGTDYPEVDLGTQSSYTFKTPFDDTVWAGSPTDEYKNPVFAVTPGSVTINSSKINPDSYAIAAWGQNAGWKTDSGDATKLVGLKEPSDLQDFSFVLADNSLSLGAEVQIVSNFHFLAPFDDSKYGDYRARLTIITPRGEEEQLGPNLEATYKDHAGAIEADKLFLVSNSKSGDAAANFWYNADWYGQKPPSATGGQNIPNTEVSTGWGRSVMEICWTVDSTGSSRFIDSTMGFDLGIDVDIFKKYVWTQSAYVIGCLTFDYMAIEFSYRDTIHGQTPTTAALPIPVKLDTQESKGPSWTFSSSYIVNSKTWEVMRGASFPENVAKYKFSFQSIIADYYSHYTLEDRINGIKMALNGMYPPVSAMEQDEVSNRYTLTVLDLESYFLANDPTAPVGTKHVRLRLDIVGDGSLQKTQYMYDFMIFSFRAEYPEFFAPCDIEYSFGAAEKYVTFGFPNSMKWLPGSFEHFLTEDSVYIAEIQVGTTHYTNPVVQSFQRFADGSDPNPDRVDLPLWDMDFEIEKDWNTDGTNNPFRVYITLDTVIPSVTPSWPDADPEPNGFKNVGFQDFSAHYEDGESPVVAALLWWEQLDERMEPLPATRKFLVMGRSAIDGIGLVGNALGTIYPGDTGSFTPGSFYRFFCEIIDGGGNFVVSSMKVYIIIQETAPPSITITSPPIVAQDAVVFGTSAGVPQFTITVVDVNVDPASVRFYMGSDQFLVTDLTGGYFRLDATPSGAWATYWDTLPSGSYAARFYAEDTFDRWAAVDFTLVKDYEQPACMFLPPWGDGTYVSTAPALSLSIRDTVSWVEKVWYSFVANPTQSDGSWHLAASYVPRKTPPEGEEIAVAIATSDWDAHVAQGPCRISFTITDTGGNNATIQGIDLIRDSIAPHLILDRPATGLMQNGSAPAFRLLAVDNLLDGLATVGYRIGNAPNHTLDIGSGTWSVADEAWVYDGTLNQGDWDALANETVIVVQFFALDKAANMDLVTTSVTVDKVGPRILVLSPAPGSVAGGFAISFDLDVVEPHLSGLWYSLDNGTTFVPITKLSDVFDQAQWDAAAGTRELRILFKGRDMLNNYGYAEVTIIRSDYDEGGLPWQVMLCMAGAAGVMFSVNALNKKRVGGR